MTIGICAPSRAIDRSTADHVLAISGTSHPEAELVFHEQCFAGHGHFAGPDIQRRDAFVELANDPEVDAIWFARGGYGACRIAGESVAMLGDAACSKSYMGYSDGGNMLAALYRAGIGQVAHGPMVADIGRTGGDTAIARALDWLLDRDPQSLAAGLEPDTPYAAFNLMTFAMLVGSDLLPDLAGHVLVLEEVDEHLYAIDRAFFAVTNALAGKGLKGIALGRVSGVPENDIDFVMTAEEIAQSWCARSGIAYAGRMDIGHDADNKVVPFGSR
ncbi:LD-carboxypeptidase [Alterisphingorhabdus coralli]|uniref:LD-carboxypeptidase n=1 Tax=Alterisphingorhabdus coralli TaxID=3071408 RepID=A0AA97FCM7_9SPHN|nr:LD-carboxypeptidase [Parasphingorhabdus sp. SCSIO 66989]WOE76615.1 LD-carboxypeptidase [Parasphingorhabdus sp. SCSIO 66989]